MELNIPDLLDGLQDESVSIQPCTQSSRDRIKELTMKKTVLKILCVTAGVLLLTACAPQADPATSSSSTVPTTTARAVLRKNLFSFITQPPHEVAPESTSAPVT